MLRNIKKRVFSKTLAMDSEKNIVRAVLVNGDFPVNGDVAVKGSNVYQKVPLYGVSVLRPGPSDYEWWAASCCIFIAFWLVVGIIASM